MDAQLVNARVFNQASPKGYPNRGASTSKDWTEENEFNFWRGLRLIKGRLS